MTEQELREKIVGILRYHRDDFIEENYRRDIERIDFEAVADVLILEGIGDVSEWKHRAEVAERALDLCETAYVLAINGMKTHGISLQAITSNLGVHGFFMRQAEKELQEERKDDNN